MSGLPAVRVAGAAELETASRILTEAFVDEAGLNYWLRQDDQKDRARRKFFDAAVREVVHPDRDLWVADAGDETLGAAIWLKPGLKAFDFSFLQQFLMAPLLLSIAGAAGAMRGLDLGERLEKLHPRDPHAHLVFLGVARAAQGQGVGSAILKATLAPLDAAGVPAMLEATTERNVALYQRHGFEIIDELKLSDLHFRIMARAPRR